MSEKSYLEIMEVVNKNVSDLLPTETDKLLDLLKRNRKGKMYDSFPFFDIRVSYSTPIRSLIRQTGCIFQKSDDFMAKNTSVEGFTSRKLEMFLVGFDESVSGDYVLAEMAKVDLRPATMREMLCLYIQKPEIEKKMQGLHLGNFGLIAALGSTWKIDGRVEVSAIQKISIDPFLLNYSLSSGWDPRCRFAAVSTKQNK